MSTPMIFILTKYRMQLQTNSLCNITIVNDLFDTGTLINLINQVEESRLDFDQRYPRRLFSANHHQDLWLSYFDEPLRQVFGDYQLQQIFLGLDLPGSHFSYHHSHLAIRHVAMFSLDDFAPIRLRVVHDPACDLNYAGPSTFANKNYPPSDFSDFDFQQNQWLIINNHPNNRAWGFTEYMPPGSIKRTVWAYLS